MPDGVEKEDLTRVHERIDDVEDDAKEARAEYFDVLRKVESRLSSIESKVEGNDDKTDKLTDMVRQLRQENQARQHDLEMHAANCPGRRTVRTIIFLLSASGTGGIIAWAVTHFLG